MNIQGPYSGTPGFFFHSFCCWTFVSCMNRLTCFYVPMFRFLETDIREQKNVWKENTSICAQYSKWSALWNQVWKLFERQKIIFLFSETLFFFFKQKCILFLETYFFKIPKNLITSAFFFSFSDTKETCWGEFRTPRK